VSDPYSQTHLRLPLEDAGRVFLIENVFQDGAGLPNALITDPPRAPLHVQ
jgi:hypothetical protein